MVQRTYRHSGKESARTGGRRPTAFIKKGVKIIVVYFKLPVTKERRGLIIGYVRLWGRFQSFLLLIQRGNSNVKACRPLEPFGILWIQGLLTGVLVILIQKGLRMTS